MSTTQTCPQCGLAMRAGADEGEVCPKCLLSLGIDAPPAHLTPFSSSAVAATRAPDHTRLPGARVSHYVIRDTLGRGGMGIVYRAEDIELGRFVALKFLPDSISSDPRAVARFRREARAAAALNHPHICSIHEIGDHDGTPFIVMELISGSTLGDRIANGPLPSKSVLTLGIQLADALEAAHDAGIIHRDIKPTNIFITDRGEAKVLDFGLAKWVRTDETVTDVPTNLGDSHRTDLTDTGSTLGTIAYMAPEQALGRRVDQRTDLFAVGHVLYEAATGERAFNGPNAAAIIDAILNREPTPAIAINARIHPRLDIVISNLLRKSPDARPQSAAALRSELELIRGDSSPVVSGISATANVANTQRSIAVLPFADMSPQKDQEYFCDGLSEELINSLSKLRDLSVASRTSTFAFKDTGTDIREIGRRLGVDAALEGSVRKVGERLRVTVQLVNVADGYQLWSERYDRELEDVFAIYDDVAKAVVDRLEVTLGHSAATPIVRRYTEDPDAYNAYLKGRYFWNRRNRGLLKKAIHYFEEAIALDPSFALAHTGLADSYTALGIYSVLPPQIARAKVEAAVETAMAVDANLVEARNSRALIHQYFDWDWQGAQREFLLSIDLDPGNAISRGYYAVLLVLCLGRFDEARAQANLAQELDPLSVMANTLSSIAFYYMGDYDRALRDSDRALEIEPDCLMALWIRGCSWSEKGLHEGAVAALEKAVEVSEQGHFFVAVLGVVCCRANRADEARRILNTLLEESTEGFVDPFLVALLYEGLGERDTAFEWLEKAYELKSCVLCQLTTIPHLEGMRGDPRYLDLVTRLSLRTPTD